MTRLLPDDEVTRMTGARSGLIHALLYVREVIQRHDPDARYRAIPQHHTAKRRAAAAKVAVLRDAERKIDDAQKRCEVALAGDRALRGRAESSAQCEPRTHLIWSEKWGCWHRRSTAGGAAGYTDDICQAGIFETATALAYGNEPTINRAVPAAEALPALHKRLAEIEEQRAGCLAAIQALLGPMGSQIDWGGMHALVGQVARMNHESEQEGGMSPDDAVDTLNSMITWARSLVGGKAP